MNKYVGFVFLILSVFVPGVSAEDIGHQLNGGVIFYTGPQTGNGMPVVVIDDFNQLTYDYAKRLPAELYYWWAINHNSRQKEAFSQSPSVLQISEGFRGIVTQPGNRNRVNNGQYNGTRTTTIRMFTPDYGDGPAIIYNPYFR